MCFSFDKTKNIVLQISLIIVIYCQVYSIENAEIGNTLDINGIQITKTLSDIRIYRKDDGMVFCSSYFQDPGSFISVFLLQNDMLEQKNKEIYNCFLNYLYKNLVIRNKPDGSLEWLINKYALNDNDSLFSVPIKWYDGMPTITNEPYGLIIDSEQYNKLSGHSYLKVTNTCTREKNDKYMLIYYYNNHRIVERKNGKRTEIQFSQISEYDDFKVFKTSHGVFISKKGKYLWIFISDNVYKLRHPSIMNVTIGGKYMYITESTIYEEKMYKVDYLNGNYKLVKKSIK